MHRNPFPKLLFLTLLLAVAAGCTKQAEGIPGATGAAGQAGANGIGVKSSAITGYIALLDPYGNPYPYSPNVAISVQKGDSFLRTTTDSTGKFSLPALPPGNYSIHVTKTGFDSLEIFVQHSGGDEAKFIGSTNLIQTLSTKITGQTLTVQGNTNLMITTSFTLDPGASSGYHERDFFYYFSHSKTVSSRNFDYASGSGQGVIGNQLMESYPLINLTQNATKPFHTGDTVWLKSIIYHPFSIESYYFDYTNNIGVRYPFLGDSTLNWFQMP
ncbi:MAG TPA: carboxypeptidase-like regulatory domain-containing protein [Puia sp.]|uniref:carboxypeptidase-like regulatory domain-containing protein n=1 Tax=Puia sp. TaxID=2045100 RepID=UPI002CCC34F2|nr:carboxypeptidase-like regulatory domain-containing protein [Puia sp.]HVU95207.1 carboxypeptidase-like regulatory domain-containing protein [Puia sp.]